MSVDQYRELLAASGLTFSKPVGELAPSYVERLGRGLARSIAEGRPFSRQAERGHVTTREHPTRELPKIAAERAIYRPPKHLDRLPNNVFRSEDARRKEQVVRALREFRDAGRPATLHVRPGREGVAHVQIVGRFKNGQWFNIGQKGGYRVDKLLDALNAKGVRWADELAKLLANMYRGRPGFEGVEEDEEDEIDALDIDMDSIQLFSV